VTKPKVCDHTLGYCDGDYDSRGYPIHASDSDDAFHETFHDIDVHFAFCPLCGARLDWEAMKAERQAAKEARERREDDEEAELEREERAAEAEALYAERMRGAAAEEW
jgi:hypothetical protein